MRLGNWVRFRCLEVSPREKTQEGEKSADLSLDVCELKRFFPRRKGEKRETWETLPPFSLFSPSVKRVRGRFPGHSVLCYTWAAFREAIFQLSDFCTSYFAKFRRQVNYR